MNQYETMRRLADLGESMEPTDEVNMTGLEVAELLGFDISDPDKINLTDLANACLGIQSNEQVMTLPKPQRLRAIRSAAGVLDMIVYGGR